MDWALGDDAQDLRQLALVFDWCGPVMTPAQMERLGAKIRTGSDGALRQTAGGDIAAARVPGCSPRSPSPIVSRITARPCLKPMMDAVERHRETGWKPATRRFRAHEVYALFEMLHAIRDNLKIDLREDASVYFRELPLDHLTSHYPASFQAPENEYRVPAFVRDGEPDVSEATLSRAAELSMVAFDANEAGNQFLQGWLTQDRFVMRGALGAPYEFLWANPYQPGLSYEQAPLMFHDAVSGHLFARTSWDEDATWIGYFDGHLQLFRDGRIVVLRPGGVNDPVHVGDANILSVANQDAAKFHVGTAQTFVLGLARRATYDVEIDDEELREARDGQRRDAGSRAAGRHGRGSAREESGRRVGAAIGRRRQRAVCASCGTADSAGLVARASRTATTRR